MAGLVGDKLVRILDFDDDTVTAVDSPLYIISACKEATSSLLGRVVCGWSGGVDLVDIMQNDDSYGINCDFDCGYDEGFGAQIPGSIDVGREAVTAPSQESPDNASKSAHSFIRETPDSESS
eukprot:4850277-Ditylum_brightwellii.AAC.1